MAQASRGLSIQNPKRISVRSRNQLQMEPPRAIGSGPRQLFRCEILTIPAAARTRARRSRRRQTMTPSQQATVLLDRYPSFVQIACAPCALLICNSEIFVKLLDILY